MNPFEFVLAIIVLVFAYKLVDTWVRNRSQRRPDEPAAAELLQRLDRIEERVSVLERIVTDERYDLKKQFKDLER